MHPHPVPPPSAAPPTPHPQGGARHLQRRASRRTAQSRAQRTFLLLNAGPLAAGIMLFPFTDIPARPVYGRLTLGVAWGIGQCILFVATAWWLETRWARPSESAQPLPASGMPQAQPPGTQRIPAVKQ